MSNASAFVASSHEAQYDLGLGLTHLLLGEDPEPNDPYLLMTHVVPVAAWAIAALLIAAILRYLIRLRSHGVPTTARADARWWARMLLPAAALLALASGLLAAPLGLARHFYPDASWALTVTAYAALVWSAVRLLVAAVAARRARRPVTDEPIRVRPEPVAHGSVRRASLIAGSGLLVMAVLAAFGYMIAVDALVTPDDAARTASDIKESAGLFRAGIVSLFVVVLLDVVVAWALYLVFRPVSKAVSMIAAWARIVYAGVFAVAVAQLSGVLRLLDDTAPDSATSLVQAETTAAINRFTDIWDAGLILFGLHLLTITWLAYRSQMLPKWLTLLVGIAGLGYVVDGAGTFLVRGDWTEVSVFAFVGELLLAFFLLMRGRPHGRRDADRDEPVAPATPVGVGPEAAS